MKKIFSFGSNVSARLYDSGRSIDEFVVLLVLRGKGEFFIGDNVVPFVKNDLFFFAGRIARSFNDDQNNGRENKSNNLKVISLFFNLSQIEEALNNVPEAYHIKKLISFADYGLKLSCTENRALANQVLQIHKAKGLHKMLSFYKLIDHASRNKDIMVLSAKAAMKCNQASEEPKLRKIFDFIKENHRDTITLEQISAIANMSPTGFCRFFKSHEQKTFSQYLAEVRIESACKMLKDKGYSISDCCYGSGFNNLSNFNRHFKKQTGMSPSEYRIKVTGDCSGKNRKCA
ncbi:helix-turn-helix domain-containing protein [Zobellia galactanivorans]|uniref:AraC-type transcriptional regulator n=1 Tax=Zobellia galactanivorans (strain DSM 12802 / CCUG 47099 / CIP 106680 / NCIMB 13871 / Dsij) TaxID=63186 RepID=G0L175_ZOBGA|nr:AraC family transcriptional regulator [Zobellia galactanivorans]MBU3024204.1 AraC family transcriptional regulator [Zobellia galactanivorans]CAZ97684.1 AraC-type transcriptional regulator [Zobellia galactanivorans]